MNAKQCALKYLSMGLSVIAIAPNGSKGPATVVGSWLPFMTGARATPQQVDAWWPEGTRNGVAIVGGILSNDLAVIDIETGDAYAQYRSDCQQEGLLYALDSCPIVVTPNGGRHIYCFGVQRKNLKLAKSTEGKTLIEIKGSNGYVLAPGSTEECHPTGLLYRWENNSLLELPAPALPVDSDDFDLMVTVATIQNVGKFPEKFTLPIQAGEIKDNRKRPGDDYNERADWGVILQSAGWEISRIGQDKIYWRRAGKDDGISGTTGHCRTDGSGDMLYVFSSNAAPFQEAKAYSKFAAYTLLTHDGNFSAATRALAGEGYGEPEVELNFLHKPKAEDAPLKIEPDPVTGLEYEIIGKMKRDTTERVWHWYGFVTGGGVTLFSAIWKIGKTTLLTGLLKSWIEGDSFLGQKVSKCKALVISEEHRDFWIDRHAETGVGDEDQHGVWCKPFTAQMSMKQWFEYVAQLAFIMKRDGFSVLIIDTISKIWPVKDENSATEVQQAINALDYITKPGMSVILVHHHRKGGGENHTASRGSGALSSAVDICMDFTRDEGGYGNKSKTRRLITTTGRCGRATPYEVLIDFVDEQLVRLGDKDQVDATARKKSIIEVLDKDNYYTLEYIREASGQREAFVRKHLEALVNDGEVEMIGTGGRGDKKRWRIVTIKQPTQNNLGDFNGSAQSF